LKSGHRSRSKAVNQGVRSGGELIVARLNRAGVLKSVVRVDIAVSENTHLGGTHARAAHCNLGFPRLAEMRKLVRRGRFSRRPIPSPVVAVSETAAGIANDGRFDSLQRIDNSGANPTGVWHARCFANPDSVIDHGAEVFDEVTVDVRVNGTDPLIEENFYTRVGRSR